MTVATYLEFTEMSVHELSELHRLNFPQGPVATKKSEACRALAALAMDHGLTLADMRNPGRAQPAPADDITKLSDALSSLRVELDLRASALDNSISTATMDIDNRIRKVKNDLAATIIDTVDAKTESAMALRQIAAVNSEQAKLQNTIDTLTDQVAKAAAAPAYTVDQAAIDATVTAKVDAAFGAFKSIIVAAGAQAAVADTACALSACQIMNVEDAFSVRVTDAKGQVMALTHWHRADAPAVDPCFIWTASTLRHLLLAAGSSSTLANVWLGGEKGAGKSETARQFAARTGRSFTRINFQRFTTVEDFLGATGLDSGSTAFEAGPFLKAYSTPGSVILLDEITNADPGVLNALNGFLEPNAAVTFGGTVWTKAPGVLILAADNTLGNGDQSGRYAGTRAQGAPLMNRFGQIVHMTFLPKAVEVQAVVKRTGCSTKLANYVLDAIAIARAKVQTGEIIDAPSIRNVMAFIESLQVLPVRDAWNTTIAAAQPAESAVALQSVYESCISEATIQKLI
jgi:MoxR-like ATPase